MLHLILRVHTRVCEAAHWHTTHDKFVVLVCCMQRSSYVDICCINTVWWLEKKEWGALAGDQYGVYVYFATFNVYPAYGGWACAYTCGVSSRMLPLTAYVCVFEFVQKSNIPNSPECRRSSHNVELCLLGTTSALALPQHVRIFWWEMYVLLLRLLDLYEVELMFFYRSWNIAYELSIDF